MNPVKLQSAFFDQHQCVNFLSYNHFLTLNKYTLFSLYDAQTLIIFCPLRLICHWLFFIKKLTYFVAVLLRTATAR